MTESLFYTTTEKCERGAILWVDASGRCPGFFICNPLDFDEINEKIIGRKLVWLDSYLVSPEAINAFLSNGGQR